MGQQQLLLIVLGVIIVGIAVVVGINVFTVSSSNANRDAVISDLTTLAAMAQQYYRKPKEMGGGGNTFTGWKIPKSLAETANGKYKTTIGASEIKITGIGVENDSQTDKPISVLLTVGKDKIKTEINTK